MKWAAPVAECRRRKVIINVFAVDDIKSWPN